MHRRTKHSYFTRSFLLLFAVMPFYSCSGKKSNSSSPTAENKEDKDIFQPDADQEVQLSLDKGDEILTLAVNTGLEDFRVGSFNYLQKKP